MNFCIGQRVRVKFARSSLGRPFVGREGVINRIETWCGGEPGYGLDISPIEWVPGEGMFAWSGEQLEAARPDGLESIEDINALYEPSPNEVLANTGMRMEWLR